MIDSEPVLFKSLKEPLQRVLLMETKVFVKPNEQSQACLNSAMARKRAKKWNYLHLRPRVESITDDNVELNCSMTRKYSSERSEFLRFNLYLRYVISEFCLFIFATLR